MIKCDKIHYYENVIKNPKELVYLIESTDSYLNENTSITKWKKWSASNSEYVFGEQKWILDSINTETNNSLVFINKEIKDCIYNYSDQYAKEHNLELGYLTPLSISKYHIGKHMGLHTDSYENDNNSENNISPTLSIVVYLNDNYEGGELYFKNQKVTIKPSAGSIVIFPSNMPYLHESKVIKKGTKYMSPGFWYKKL
jgi:predicted 2-oxoglutarate/Fe(II)-dependent dioxygenase YbiX